MILALDPSSTRTGYALMREDETLADAGVLRPRRTKDEPNDRILAMVDELPGLIRDFAPTAIVIEDTSGKVSSRHKGNGAGLAIHGKAVGWFIASARVLVDPAIVHAVLENTWTRGQGNKDARARRIRVAFRVKPDVDPGNDMTDAIGLARWFIRRNVDELLPTDCAVSRFAVAG